MNPKQPEIEPVQPEQEGRESKSALDPEVLTLEIATHAEALIPEEGDSAAALAEVADILRQGSDSEHLDQAQAVLEQNRAWTPATRELAFEINRVDQHERNEMPLTFADAVVKLRELGQEDINLILPDLDSTDDQEKLDAVDKLLDVVEDMMGSFPEVEEAAGVDRSVLQGYRAIRNALLLEKEGLEAALATAEAEAYEEFDDGDEDAAREKVKKAYPKSQTGPKEQDRGGDQLDDEELLAKLPDDEQQLIWYENANFHLGKRNQEQLPYLKAFVRKRIQQASKEIPLGPYTGSVTDIMGEKGEALDFLRFVVSKKLKGQLMSRGEFSKMSFSDVALTIGLNADRQIEDFRGRFSSHR